MLIRNLRLISGIYLFLFVFAHLINLAFGLLSLQLMEESRGWLIAPWTNPVGGGLLFLSLLVHIVLGLYALYQRNTLRMSGFDLYQLLLGLAIPLLLFPHMIALGVLAGVDEIQVSYRDVLQVFWIDNLWLGVRQVLGVLAVWLHCCMGLYIWLRLQSFWQSVAMFVYPTIVLLPALALLGFVEAGKVVIAEREAGVSASGEPLPASAWSQMTPELYQTITFITDTAVYGYLLLVVLALLLRWLRLRFGRQLAEIRVAGYPAIETRAGTTLLEISRDNEIEHASLCGGKGRCGTCQVRVLRGAENLSPHSRIERSKLQAIAADDDIRLACQARATGGQVQLERVLPAYVEPDDMPTAERGAPV